jgi:hypothetical protein
MTTLRDRTGQDRTRELTHLISCRSVFLVYAADAFETVVDVDIKACEFGSLVCAPNFIEAEINFCYDLNVLDFDGYQVCNNAGNYTFEKSYILPGNHSWYEDFAFEGLKFNMVAIFEGDLTCQATFVARVYYTYEAWMSWAVGSLALVTGIFYYVRSKQQEQNTPKINMSAEEAKTADVNVQKTKVVKTMPKGVKTTPMIHSIRSGAVDDDESVTTTAYKRWLDVSPGLLSHTDRMEQVREAHFERLRKTRDSRRSTDSVAQSS